MLRTASRALHGPGRHTGWVLASTSAVAAATLSYHLTSKRNVIHNDAPSASSSNVAGKDIVERNPQLSVTVENSETLSTLVWGSNRAHVLADQLPESVRLPSVSGWFDNVALRDVALNERHAACVDARGDVYQWGDGFFGDAPSASQNRPQQTLRGKNIVRIQLTRTRVFALSSSGRIYVLSASQAEQTPPDVAQPTNTSWWGTEWIWGGGNTVDFAEISPNEKLKRGERFVSIAAGADHLLALTSAGRTFAHPVTLKANTHGQLGFRKFDLAPPEPHLPRVPVELTPRAVADPYGKASSAARPSPPSDTAPAYEAAAKDGSIRFSDRLFEVPALRGVAVDKIAAGGRTSFVKTTTGRVLGWGANEFGQIGLGGNVTLDTITVPTEIVLTRSTPGSVRSTCVDVYAGGDLTAFQVERADGSAMPWVDVLTCGNGQWGGLGNASYSNAQGTPVRAKNVSGLLEYNEAAKNLQAIVPHTISISPTGHILLTLDTQRLAGPGAGGRDVVAWGANMEYQLGNGRRGSVASPTSMERADGERFMLYGRKAREVRDMQGRVYGRNVVVEQRAVAGWGNSVVYWKIV